jgi:hypothetical protein
MKKIYLLCIAIVSLAMPSIAQITISGATGTANGTYATLTNTGGAFEALNIVGSHNTGDNILITVTADITTEAGTVSLSPGVWSTVTINPNGARTISGAPAAGTPLINLNGADKVTINGLNSGGNKLTISNTTTGATAGTSTICFIADAINNTVTNCTILGSSTSTLATVAGTIVFGNGTSTGNDGNTISNNNIGPAGANLPSKAIMASGASSAIENDNVTITANNIFDFFLPGSSLSGINILTGNEGWTISNNKFYQTGARAFSTTLLRYAAITLNNSTGSFTVSGNTIGFGAADGTGTTVITGLGNEFRGIDAASVNTTAATNIQNNTISGINQTSSRASTTISASAFIGVSMGTTDGLINATGNTIGSLDASSTIVLNLTSTTANTACVMGLYNFSFFSTTISNNNIGSITIQGSGTVGSFKGIFVNTNTGVTATITNNTIAGINNTQVGTCYLYGIQTALPNATIVGNTIRNMSGNSTAASLIVSSGIISSGSIGANTIAQNTIHSLSNASGSAVNSIYGMALGMPAAANIVERNVIHSFSLTATITGTQIWGISGGATGTTTYRNNMIRLGIDAAGNPVTLPTSIIGLRDAAGATNQFYHNSVYIGGAGVLATPTASNSYCFFSDVVNVTRNFQDNIFWNARGNAVAGGVAHVAMRVGGTVLNPTGLTSNYNDLFFSGTDGAAGVFNAVVIPTFAAWNTATGQDANSITINPQFIAPTDPAATVNLHMAPTSCGVDNKGIPIAGITTDIDNNTRDLGAPDMGADEFTATLSGTLAIPAGSGTTSVMYNVSPVSTTFTNSSCETITKVLPSGGGTAVTGLIKAGVTVDPAVQYYILEPYVQRHFDIEPAVSPSTSTATVTLYFTNTEFVNYNAASIGYKSLPTSALGNADPNIANLRVNQYHGTGVLPGSYTGALQVIDPADADISWNSVVNRWEVTIPVTGFSGFYVTTTLNVPLAIAVNYFRGTKQGHVNSLTWKINCTNSPRATMTLERSADGHNFTPINTITADAVRCLDAFYYDDVNPLPGINYYRLKSVDADGRITYSIIVTLLNKDKGFEIVNITPNPTVNGQFKLNVTTTQQTKMDVVITDMTGRVVSKKAVSLISGFNAVDMNVSNLASGTYQLYGNTVDGKTTTLRFIKQ